MAQKPMTQVPTKKTEGQVGNLSSWRSPWPAPFALNLRLAFRTADDPAIVQRNDGDMGPVSGRR
jgi:hypothetical protein